MMDSTSDGANGLCGHGFMMASTDGKWNGRYLNSDIPIDGYSKKLPQPLLVMP